MIDDYRPARFFVVFMLDVINLMISSASSFKDLNCSSEISSIRRRSLSQKIVSSPSLLDIANLCTKSDADSALIDSATFAPIDVPDLSICCDIILSFFSS